MYRYEDLIDISPEQLLQKISQPAIFEWILKEPFDFNKRYCSPFRIDNKPGCRFEERPDGTILFIDFGEKFLSGHTHRSCFRMVMEAFNINLRGAMRIICNKFRLTEGNVGEFEFTECTYQKRDNCITDIKYTKKDFSKPDIKHWSQFLIRPEHLLEDNASCVKRYTISNSKGERIFSPYNCCYAFDFIDRVKIHQPYEQYKWITNCNENCIGNIDNLPATGKELVVQKSYKDHRILRNLEWGLNVIWTMNEVCIPSIEILTDLVNRFDIITLFYDNDKEGRQGAFKLAQILNNIRNGCCRFVYLPEVKRHKTLYGEYLKDPGEFISKEGKQDLITVLKAIGINGNI